MVNYVKIAQLLRLVTLLLVGVQSICTSAADGTHPMIAETWTCSYQDEKGVTDLLKARDFMVVRAGKAGLRLPSAFLWNLTKGDTSVNHVWFNVHPNIGAYGAWADALETSGISSSVSERFSSVSNCVAGMGAARMIFQRGEVPDPPVFITARSCRYTNGASEESMHDLIAQIHIVMKSLGNNAPAFSTALMPFTLRAPGSSNVLLYSGFKNASAWSNYINELFAIGAEQRLRDDISTVLDCGDLTLWSSRQVVQATK